MKFVTVTPAGRRQYLEILATYLLRHRDVIDEHHWWLNTRDPVDTNYIYRLVDRHPDFFKVIAKPNNRGLSMGASIWRYVRDCDDADTIYLRLDDDICYIGDDAVKQMRDYRLAHPEPFLVLGNIVNNAVCAHFHQQAGVVPRKWGTVENECLDNNGWGNGKFTRRLHRLFLRDVERGREAKWRNAPMPIDGTKRFSINAICWWGKDLQNLPEQHVDHIEEEEFLTEELPARLDRPNVVCQGALFSHYAFWPQRQYLEWTSPDILDRYLQLANQVAALPADHPRHWLSIALDGARWSAGSAAWQAKTGLKHVGKLLRGSGRRAA